MMNLLLSHDGRHSSGFDENALDRASVLIILQLLHKTGINYTV